ncbi:START domain-containing protein [Lewinella sp. JB7]|uniref:START domain-containing protein n=1 Tax=Lewinella sp. JB7 TaxID=2962887 RepID=UPI0020C9C5C1|nr:START domain-containing protein [Lewinella sp. JB7]MCP9235078.1 hypothetical protein [Lewinella sp. JB7]
MAIFCSCVRAQNSEGFTLESEDDGVQVFLREELAGELSVRVRTQARAPMRRVREVLDDAPRYPEWVHRCDDAYIVGGGQVNDYIFVSGIDMPFPFRDKEVVARVRQSTDGRGVLTRTITVAPSAIPPNRSRDRQEVYAGEWIVRPLASGGVELQCTVRTDAGTGLPSWLRKEVMTGGPARTIANLRRRLEASAG